MRQSADIVITDPGHLTFDDINAGTELEVGFGRCQGERKSIRNRSKLICLIGDDEAMVDFSSTVHVVDEFDGVACRF